MKTLLTFALALASIALLAGPAQAAENDAAAAASGPTRAEVKADLAKARADGTLNQKPNQDLGVAKAKAKPKKAKKSKKAKAAENAASAAQ